MDENPDCEMDVEFQLGRLPCERMHQGVQKCLMHGMLPTLFPDPFLAQRKIPTLVNIKDSEYVQYPLMFDHLSVDDFSVS